jgi:hypothetical protein
MKEINEKLGLDVPSSFDERLKSNWLYETLFRHACRASYHYH